MSGLRNALKAAFRLTVLSLCFAVVGPPVAAILIASIVVVVGLFGDAAADKLLSAAPWVFVYAITFGYLIGALPAFGVAVVFWLIDVVTRQWPSRLTTVIISVFTPPFIYPTLFHQEQIRDHISMAIGLSIPCVIAALAARAVAHVAVLRLERFGFHRGR